MSAFDRALLVAALAFFASTAALLVATPAFFYNTIPGMIESGPMNVHLIRDVGFAYGLLAIGFAASLRSAMLASTTTIAAALYLTAHAALHLTMQLAQPNARVALGEFPGVDLPAIFAGALAVRFARR